MLCDAAFLPRFLMFPFIINISHYKISSYAVVFFVGYFFSVFLACSYATKQKFSVRRIDIVLTSCFSILGIGLGAKIFYLLSVVPDLIKNYSVFCNFSFIEKVVFLFSGMVFYGGLFGAIISVYFFGKLQKFDICEMLKIIVPYYPLIHAFGRIGCFLAGCCYGIPYDGFLSVEFLYGAGAGVKRFPVQLLEAGFNILLFVFLIILRKKTLKNGRTLLKTYLVSYAIGRFFIEFLRGDEARGIILLLSTSQIISIITIAVIFVLFLISKIKKNNFS